MGMCVPLSFLLLRSPSAFMSGITLSHRRNNNNTTDTVQYYTDIDNDVPDPAHDTSATVSSRRTL